MRTKVTAVKVREMDWARESKALLASIKRYGAAAGGAGTA